MKWTELVSDVAGSSFREGDLPCGSMIRYAKHATFSLFSEGKIVLHREKLLIAAPTGMVGACMHIIVTVFDFFPGEDMELMVKQ